MIESEISDNVLDVGITVEALDIRITIDIEIEVAVDRISLSISISEPYYGTVGVV